MKNTILMRFFEHGKLENGENNNLYIYKKTNRICLIIKLMILEIYKFDFIKFDVNYMNTNFMKLIIFNKK